MLPAGKKNLSNTIGKTPLLQLTTLLLAVFQGGIIVLRDKLVLLPIAISQYEL